MPPTIAAMPPLVAKPPLGASPPVIAQPLAAIPLPVVTQQVTDQRASFAVEGHSLLRDVEVDAYHLRNVRDVQNWEINYEAFLLCPQLEFSQQCPLIIHGTDFCEDLTCPYQHNWCERPVHRVCQRWRNRGFPICSSISLPTAKFARYYPNGTSNRAPPLKFPAF
jgi:hypothetical protein